MFRASCSKRSSEMISDTMTIKMKLPSLIRDTLKVYTKAIAESQALQALILLALVVASFLIFHPVVRVGWDKVYQNNLIEDMAAQIMHDEVDYQKYWELREKSSRGEFTFNEDYIDVFQTFRIDKVNENDKTDLLYYHSQKISSTESIITSPDYLTNLIESKSSQDILFENDRTLITDEDGETHIYFVANIEDMRRTVGFFDYTSSERELLQNKYWLHHTVISAD